MNTMRYPLSFRFVVFQTYLLSLSLLPSHPIPSFRSLLIIRPTRVYLVVHAYISYIRLFTRYRFRYNTF